MTKELHISMFGEKEVPKLDLIRYYLKTKNYREIKPKEGRITFEIKTSSITQVKIYEYSDVQNVRNKDVANNNLCVFIIFDMTNRKSFLNILDKWIKYLREVKYNNKIILFGVGKKEVLPVTDEKEINYLISICKMDGEFHDLRNMEESDKCKLIDDLIESIFISARNINNKKDCNIF